MNGLLKKFFIVLNLAVISLPAFAFTPNSNPNQPFWVQLVPLVLLFAIFYLLVIRPQQKRVKKHRQMISSLKKGDEVILNSGFYGKVSKITGDANQPKAVFVEIADKTEVKVLESAISQVLTKNKEEKPVK